MYEIRCRSSHTENQCPCFAFSGAAVALWKTRCWRCGKARTFWSLSVSSCIAELNVFSHAFLCLVFAGGFPGAMPGGMPGMAGMPGLNEILSDPEVLAAMQVSIWLKSKLNARNEGGTAPVSWGKKDVTLWRAVGSACLFLLWNFLSVHVWHQTVWNLLAICQIDRNLIKDVMLCLPPSPTRYLHTRDKTVCCEEFIFFWVSWTVILYTVYFSCSFLNVYTSWWDNYAQITVNTVAMQYIAVMLRGELPKCFLPEAKYYQYSSTSGTFWIHAQKLCFPSGLD